MARRQHETTGYMLGDSDVPPLRPVGPDDWALPASSGESEPGASPARHAVRQMTELAAAMTADHPAAANL